MSSRRAPSPNPTDERHWSRPCSPSWGRGISIRAATAVRPKPRPRCAVAPATGRSPYPVAERLARPVDLECDGLVVVDHAAPSAPLGRTRPAVGRRRRRRSPKYGHPPPRSDEPAQGPARGGARPRAARRRRRGRCGPRSRAPVLDAARDARPRDGAHARVHPRARTVRPAAGDVPGGAVPAHRRRGGAGRARGAGEVLALEHRRRVGPKPSTTRWPCERPRSRRPTSCSAWPTSCTAPSASATRRRCRGSRGSACRSDDCRSVCRRRARSSSMVWARAG